MHRDWIYDDGSQRLVGKIYDPTAAPNGQAVLVLHEADGIGPNVRRRCEMLAALGYIAAAADMHGEGRVLASDEIAPAMARFRADATLVRSRVGAAFKALQSVTGLPPTAIAAIGYCFGGYAVLELARSGVPAGAIASFHGILTTARTAQAGEIQAPILASTGVQDPLVPAEEVGSFEAEMLASKTSYHLLKHGRALHSFTNAAVDQLRDPRMAYDPQADAISWSALLAFLDNTMRANPSE